MKCKNCIVVGLLALVCLVAAVALPLIPQKKSVCGECSSAGGTHVIENCGCRDVVYHTSLWRYISKQPQDSHPTEQTPSTSTWKEYVDSRYNFTFKYPPELSIETSERKGQWQISVIKNDSPIEGPYDVMYVFVDSFTTPLKEVYGPDAEPREGSIEERGVMTIFGGIEAARVAFCEIGMPYNSPCELPTTDEEILQTGKKLMFVRDGRTYTLMLPWYGDDMQLFNGVASTFRFQN